MVNIMGGGLQRVVLVGGAQKFVGQTDRNVVGQRVLDPRLGLKRE